MENNIKFSFLKKVEATLKSLEGDKFTVKTDGKGNHSVFCKSIVIVGPLPEKDIAESIAKEYNDITKKRINSISNALKKAEAEVEKTCVSIISNVSDAIICIDD